jgi:hypothetical protein
MPFVSRLFSICPHVNKQGNRLVASTAWLVRILTLGWLYRKVLVDPEKKEIRIYRRYFWVFPRRRRIRFAAVEAVTYGYEDWAPDASYSWSHDSVDCFAVGLRLLDGEELHLFYFYGDGTFSNDGPWPDWLYWEEYAFDSSGTQEKESRAFVELLSKLMGVSVVPPNC